MADDTSKLRQEIIELKNSKSYRALQSFYSEKSFFEILNIERFELAHSSFLSWLLNPKETHELEDYPIKKFLELLVQAIDRIPYTNKAAMFPLELQDVIVSSSYEIKSAKVETEKGDRTHGRFDIFVNVEIELKSGEKEKLAIIIENKVKSKEGHEQTTRYLDWAKKNIDSKTHSIFVFIKPISNSDLFVLNEPQCKEKNYIQINYQFIVDYLIEPCGMLAEKDSVKFVIDNYLRALSFSASESDDNPGGEFIMAFSAKERQLLKDFWDAHKQIFSKVVLTLTEDDAIDEEDRESLEKLKDVIVKVSNKDYSKFIFEGKKYPKNRLVLALVKRYCELNTAITYEDLLKAFPDTLHYDGSRYGVVKEISAAKSIDRKYPRFFFGDDEIIRLTDGKEVVVCSQWGPNVQAVINKVKDYKFDVVKDTN
jgi:hypothetical protein